MTLTVSAPLDHRNKYEKNIWLLSDTHFFHKNVLKYDKERGARFATVEDMNEWIINQINMHVKEDDILYHLGDLSLGNPLKTVELLERIKCKNLYWTIGNHDSKKMVNTCGHLFKDVATKFEIFYNFKKIRLSHFPPLGYDNHVNYEPTKYDYVIFGHTHKPSPYWMGMDISFNGEQLLYNLNDLVG